MILEPGLLLSHFTIGYVQNIHRASDRVVLVYAVEFHSEQDSRWLYCE